MPRWIGLRGVAIAAAFVLTGSATGATASQSCPNVGFTIVEPTASSRTRPVKFRGEQILQVRRDALTRTSDIIEAKLERSYGKPVLLLKFRPRAADRLEKATTDHDGLQLAFVADDEALLSSTWRGKYGMGREGAQVSIEDSSRLNQLLESLRSCIAPVASRPPE